MSSDPGVLFAQERSCMQQIYNKNWSNDCVHTLIQDKLCQDSLNIREGSLQLLTTDCGKAAEVPLLPGGEKVISKLWASGFFSPCSVVFYSFSSILSPLSRNCSLLLQGKVREEVGRRYQGDRSSENKYSRVPLLLHGSLLPVSKSPDSWTQGRLFQI